MRCQDEIESLLAKTRDTRKISFVTYFCFEDRSKAHKFALYVKDIDSIASSIKDEDLLNHFDRFLTITEVSNENSRNKLINRAGTYRTISENPKKENLSYEITSPKIDIFFTTVTV